jgi:hypothetical protein
LAVHTNFLYKYLYDGFNAPETPDPAALVVPDIVGMFQVVFLLVLGQVGAEAFGGYRFCGVVVAPHFVDGIKFLGCDLGVCFEEEVMWL